MRRARSIAIDGCAYAKIAFSAVTVLKESTARCDKEDCSIIIPLDGNHVYLVEQFRYTVQQRLFEFPQGGWETNDINPEELARGELKEETGLIADKMQFLGTTYVAYGYANQKMHIFLATGLTESDKEPDPEEHDLRLRRVPVTEFEAMLRDGRIPDVCTVAAWGMYLLANRLTNAGAASVQDNSSAESIPEVPVPAVPVPTDAQKERKCAHKRLAMRS